MARRHIAILCKRDLSDSFVHVGLFRQINKKDLMQDCNDVVYFFDGKC